MTVDDQISPAIRVAQPLQSARPRVRAIARRALWRLAPRYARRRARKAGIAATLDRLEADLEHVRKRHTEQIERLEDLVRELVLTAESLRRDIAQRDLRDRD